MEKLNSVHFRHIFCIILEEKNNTKTSQTISGGNETQKGDSGDSLSLYPTILATMAMGVSQLTFNISVENKLLIMSSFNNHRTEPRHGVNMSCTIQILQIVMSCRQNKTIIKNTICWLFNFN